MGKSYCMCFFFFFFFVGCIDCVQCVWARFLILPLNLSGDWTPWTQGFGVPQMAQLPKIH